MLISDHRVWARGPASTGLLEGAGAVQIAVLAQQ
jgi:hypothetical protein